MNGTHDLTILTDKWRHSNLVYPSQTRLRGFHKMFFAIGKKPGMRAKGRRLPFFVNEFMAGFAYHLLLRHPKGISHRFICPEYPVAVVKDHDEV
jgi:hypothetical protein